LPLFKTILSSSQESQKPKVIKYLIVFMDRHLGDVSRYSIVIRTQIVQGLVKFVEEYE